MHLEERIETLVGKGIVEICCMHIPLRLCLKIRKKAFQFLNCLPTLICESNQKNIQPQSLSCSIALNKLAVNKHFYRQLVSLPQFAFEFETRALAIIDRAAGRHMRARECSCRRRNAPLPAK